MNNETHNRPLSTLHLSFLSDVLGVVNGERVLRPRWIISDPAENGTTTLGSIGVFSSITESVTSCSGTYPSCPSQQRKVHRTRTAIYVDQRPDLDLRCWSCCMYRWEPTGHQVTDQWTAWAHGV